MRIIYFDMDGLRPDHMSCYGYLRATTPHMDQIAREGAMFKSCYCVSSPGEASQAGLLSGQYAIRRGTRDCDSAAVPSLPHSLSETGLRTIAFSSIRTPYDSEWAEFHHAPPIAEDAAAEAVTAAVIPWLRMHGSEESYFLHIRYSGSSGMYSYPRQHMEIWKEEPMQEYPDERTIQRHRGDVFPRSAMFLQMTTHTPDTVPWRILGRKEFKHLIDGYDGAIHYLDDHVGQVLEALSELGLRDEVGIIISAGCGESLGEQGIYMDKAAATEAVHHIPLILKIPGVTKPGIEIEGIVGNIDVTATISGMAGLPTPDGWDGKSFLPALRGESWEGRTQLVMEHCLHTCQRSVRDSKWQYIRTYHPGLYDFPETTLFDMIRDPHQTTNVADQFPDVVASMDRLIEQWTHENLERSISGVDPMWQAAISGPWGHASPEEWVKRLRREGLVAASESLQAKYD